MSSVEERARQARVASRLLGTLSGDVRRRALVNVAGELKRRGELIEEANRKDYTRAEESRLSTPLLKRLRFDADKQAQAITGVESVADLPDPLGQLLEHRELDHDLILSRRTTPIGVIGMIFESRPDALVQIAALALKSGNAVVLKGGSEAKKSNRILATVIHDAAVAVGAPEGWLQLVETREDVRELLRMDQYVDLVIPRGSNAFVRYIMDNSRIPVLGHADGICHLFVDRSADADMAVAVALDSKTQYVAVCNAVETILVHEDAAAGVLPALGRELAARGVEIRGCVRTKQLLPEAVAATDADWNTEYLDLCVSIRVVNTIEEAIDHINTRGSGHTDGIVAGDRAAAERFIREVDSASVMWNASTRFADGFRYGLGAEVGISTSRIHARGPVGVSGLLSTKWIVEGHGNIVEDYVSGKRAFTHRTLPTERE